jgi:ABC-type polar amino acid transport system ATPase subunit
VIEVKNLVKLRGQTRVLDDVTLKVERGHVAALIGPSGGGKSTLLRCMNGLEVFHEGAVQLDTIKLMPGEQRSASSETLRQLRRSVGMVFQQFNLFPHMTALQNVMSGPLYALNRPRAQVEPQAKTLLERVGLGEKFHSRPDQLSGGQQQRVAIARALAMQPEVMLFDEPTSALDPRMAAEVLNVMTDLAQSGQTMIVVTHAMGFAQQVARTVHVMQAGRIVESGPPAQIFGAPQQAATQQFLSEAVTAKIPARP